MEHHLADMSFLQEPASSSSSQPIPILAPPPAPLNIVPSRARRQLAARLALHKQQADAAAQNSTENSNADDSQQNDGQWQSNPFIIADLDDSANSPDFPSAEFSSMDETEEPSSPTFHTGFTPPGSPSTNSSDEANSEPKETVRRKVRVPLEVDDDDDDDEMGEMVGPSSNSGMMDSDEEDEAIINESLGYSNFFAANRYGGFRRSYDGNGQSSFDEDEEDEDSSDGEDGLVEILVPGRKSSSST